MKYETIKQCSIRLGVPASMIRECVRSGKFAAGKIANKYLIDVDSCNQYFESKIKKPENQATPAFDFEAELKRLRGNNK